MCNTFPGTHWKGYKVVDLRVLVQAARIYILNDPYRDRIPAADCKIHSILNKKYRITSISSTQQQKKI